MRKNNKALDGFVPRNSGRLIGSSDRDAQNIGSQGGAMIGSEKGIPIQSADFSSTNKAVSRNEIDESLKDIDSEPNTPPRRRWLQGSQKRPAQRRHKLVRWGIRLAVIAVLILGLFIAGKAFIATTSIFKGNFFGLFQQKQLKMDSNGRTNILVLGTSGSVDDQSHEGANLTDSLMVLSIDQKKKDAYMISIPRDLWVEYGAACDAGYQGKINALYVCYSNDGQNEEAGAKALEDKITQVTGLTMQYYLHVNWAVLIGAVNAVGGIDITIQSNDPRGILDRNFDWVCKYRCYYVNYKQGEHAHLDGEHALALARARNDAGGYGLSGGNFDREKNQQLILKALKDKATSAGTLTDLGKVTSLMDSLGKNIKSNFDTSEIQTIVGLTRDIPSDKITSISLVDATPPLVTTGMVSGQSIVEPTAGLLNYSDIQAYIHKQLNANDITRENAHLALFNGSGIEGYAKKQSDKLEAQGFTITAVGNAPAGQTRPVTIYDLTKKKPQTKAKLEKVYGIKVSAEDPPIDVTVDTDFVVIFGPGSKT